MWEVSRRHAGLRLPAFQKRGEKMAGLGGPAECGGERRGFRAVCGASIEAAYVALASVQQRLDLAIAKDEPCYNSW